MLIYKQKGKIDDENIQKPNCIYPICRTQHYRPDSHKRRYCVACETQNRKDVETFDINHEIFRRIA